MREEFARLRDWWDARASTEEQDLADEVVNRRLRWREIERHLDGVRTILDVGGGTGAFSIPLAQRGYAVTHLDLSRAMLALARARAGDLSTIWFEEGNAVDLSRFDDRAFDLVLNLDGAISFCGLAAEQALAESARVARKTLIVTVSHRAWLVPDWIARGVAATGDVLPAVYQLLARGVAGPDCLPGNGFPADEMPPADLGPIRALLPSELRDLLGFAGLHVARVGGLGSLANLCGPETIRRILGDRTLLDHFVELCDYFDREVLPDGPGTRRRAGLIGVGERIGG